MKMQADPIRFIAPDYEYNALEEWGKQYGTDHKLEDEKRKQALLLVIQCVNDGSLTLLDGTDSPLSCQIKTYFQSEIFEMNSLWISSSQHWVCPCCGRSKFEISRLGQKNQILAKLVIHHDHIADALKAAFDKVFVDTKTDKESTTGLAFIERMAPAFSAYDAVLICEDCNNADARAKRWLKEHGEKKIKFQSFSIGQIRSFIEINPHSIHQINHEKLRELWIQVRPAYIARMKLIYAVATAAVTQDYWYERYPLDFKAIPALIDNRYTGKQPALQWLDILAFTREMQQQTYRHQSNWSRWRTEQNKIGLKPPENYLAIIHSLPGCAKAWDGLEDSWHCPICDRVKVESITNDNGKVRFQQKEITQWCKKNNAWKSIAHICADCDNILRAIKRELENDYALKIQKIYDYITPAQLSSIIIPRPYSTHLIKAKEAKQLIDTITSSYQDQQLN